ncbi:unnamed protein product [Symbiodinium natans]|uniref:Uncharacterized protein n=1 Tax=Symbiodinium natans TaxID=878477 RepID=A0A812KWC6_9DINO|nr:unnamed protein product [Symbiodinium natans]
MDMLVTGCCYCKFNTAHALHLGQGSATESGVLGSQKMLLLRLGTERAEHCSGLKTCTAMTVDTDKHCVGSEQHQANTGLVLLTAFPCHNCTSCRKTVACSTAHTSDQVHEAEDATTWTATQRTQTDCVMLGMMAAWKATFLEGTPDRANSINHEASRARHVREKKEQ